MALTKHLDRIRRMHRLIQFRRTGTPERFAQQLGISQSMLYRLLNELKGMGAPVRFSQSLQSYEYYQRTELRLGFFAPELDNTQLRAVSGGEATVRPLANHHKNQAG